MKPINSFKTIGIVAAYFIFSLLPLLNKQKGGGDILFVGILGIALLLHILILFFMLLISIFRKKGSSANILKNLAIVLITMTLFLFLDMEHIIKYFR